MPHFRDQLIAAPLKLSLIADKRSTRRLIPRSIDRGPIEAATRFNWAILRRSISAIN